MTRLKPTIALSLVLTGTFEPLAQEIDMNPPNSDPAAVTTVVESVAVLADRGEFEALSRLFADQLMLDYSSLNGQPAASKRRFDLMAEWAAVLPGFDRTRHELSNITVDVSGITATARADVEASHWMGDGFWQVGGHYDYQLTKAGNEWAITGMTFTLESEKGSRDVFGPAMAAAEKKNKGSRHRTAVAERNKETVGKFFKSLENEDIATVVGLFADDGVQINPYHGGVFPAGAEGKEGLLAYWTPVPGNFDGMRFAIDEVLATEDPSIVFVRYRGEIKLKNGAGYYKNSYYSTFRFSDTGEITEYVEIFDPVVAARGFGLLDQLK